MPIELKACPFCGNEPRLEADAQYSRVRCDCGERGGWDTNRERAVGKWNTRPVEDELEQRVRELEAEAERLRAFIGDIGGCGLSVSYGLDCPLVEEARAVLAGKEGGK